MVGVGKEGEREVVEQREEDGKKGEKVEGKEEKEKEEEVAKQEVEEEETAKQKVAKQEVGKEETAKQEMEEVETAKQEMEEVESAKQEVEEEETAKQEVGKEETVKQEMEEVETAKQEVEQEEMAKQEVAKQEVPSRKWGKEETVKQEMEEVETAKQEVETAKQEVEEEETAEQEMEEVETAKQDKEENEEEEVDKDMDGKYFDDESDESSDILHHPALLKGKLDTTIPTIEGEDTLKTIEGKRSCFPKPYDFLPPFSQLTHLSLANNKICDDEELLAVCLFPALTKLTIYNNPITLNAGKKPQLVIAMLKERLGMEVVTTKPQPAARPPPLNVFNPKRKIDTHIPKIPKKPLMLETARRLLGLECAESGCGGAQRGQAGARAGAAGLAGHAVTEPVSAPQASGKTEGSVPDPTITPEKHQGEATAEEGPVEGFFMTQVEDAAMTTEDMAVLEETQTEVPSVATDVPEKYRGYEELLDATTDPYFVDPVGIQQNVQQLEWRLRKLQLYPDPCARVNLSQQHFQPKHRKPQKPPERTCHRSKAEQMEEILRTMREQRALTVIPLARVLRVKDASSQEYREAAALLRVMQQKYSQMRRRLTANFTKLHDECVQLKGKMPEAERPPHSFTSLEEPSCSSLD
ncbi:LOW QUALITY PROTEIN: X-ray radiation resistance-associated protein 1 [Leucoraja erinacea]|uniref:LOW QUALITY PROTEIN: X-ray radiation resistance-associated protein 1 n=1 Tax=Leucoraja erinaceus TaxID=7782 RepID=UPI002457B98C|nr:LOW QUALITY PROTEIN: X-ray radiation resistance-associated protein 1 [Leucoraja erinacea]